MNRWEFMRQLEELLSDISPNEREEALQYYNDYFNDAGRENEQEVIKALGSPGQVAEIVREGLEDGISQGEFTENGFLNKASSLDHEIIKKPEQDTQKAGDFSEARAKDPSSQRGSASGRYTQDSGEFRQQGERYREDTSKTDLGGKKKEMPGWAIVLIVLGIIIASPVIFGVIASLLGTALGVLGTILAIILGAGIATLVLFVVAVALVIAGLGCMFAYPMAGLGLLGGGCICAALGILFLIGTVFLVGKGIPAVCRGIACVYHWIIDKTKGVAA